MTLLVFEHELRVTRSPQIRASVVASSSITMPA